MFAHAVQDDLVVREQLQGLFVAVEKVLNPTKRIQLFCPFGESKSKRVLREDSQLVVQTSNNKFYCINLKSHKIHSLLNAFESTFILPLTLFSQSFILLLITKY